MTDHKPTQGSAQEIEYILASYTDRNGTGCRADLELCISICAEKCSKVPAFVELAEHHYGDHLRMMRRLLDALPALLSARPAPEALGAAKGELRDAEIVGVWESMPGGRGGFLKEWGYMQFARAILAKSKEQA